MALVLIGGTGRATALPPPQDQGFETMKLPPEAQVAPVRVAAGARPLVENPKLDSTMANLAFVAKTSVEKALDLAQAQSLRLSDKGVHVQIITHGPGLTGVVEAVTKAGGEVTGIGHDDTLLQGWIPVGALEIVAAHKDVHLIRRPAQVHLLEDLHAGSSTTEGLAVINGPAWHTAGYTGSGVKIGIIDGGFEGYTGLVGTDLPASPTVKNFVDGESDSQVDGGGPHGTACAEIIHDIAPDATLYLAKISTNLDLAEAVAWLKDTHHVDIISTSLGWYNLTPGDGTGEFADLVGDTRTAGILWATAAGNDREAHWGGAYADPDGDDVHNFNGDQWVNYFGPGDGRYFAIPAGYQINAFLRWDDWTHVNQDYDLHLLRWNGSAWDTVASSTNYQNGSPGQMPTEYATAITSGGATAYGFAVERYSSSRNVHFELFAPKIEALDELVYQRSLANLADAPDAMTVAALDVTYPPYPQEPYSSEGPTNGSGGTESGGFTKPDIAGYANVATESYTGSSFNGTSSATPHVAGAAALVLSAYPSYTPSQLQSFLEERAIDRGAPGMDSVFGHGQLHLGDSPAAPAPIVRSIIPLSGVNTGTIHITNLAGSNFQEGAGVELTKSGQTGIAATGVTVVSDSQITCDFDLTGVAMGGWNVVVTNPDKESGQLVNGFIVRLPAGEGFSLYLPLVQRRWPPIPDTPVLNSINNGDGDGSYTVCWEHADLAETYSLQEDGNPGFSSPDAVYPRGTETCWAEEGKPVGTYYYRVKASNVWGDSRWSDSQSVTVQPPTTTPIPSPTSPAITSSTLFFWPNRLLEVDPYPGTSTYSTTCSCYGYPTCSHCVRRWTATLASDMVGTEYGVGGSINVGTASGYRAYFRIILDHQGVEQTLVQYYGDIPQGNWSLSFNPVEGPDPAAVAGDTLIFEIDLSGAQDSTSLKVYFGGETGARLTVPELAVGPTPTLASIPPEDESPAIIP